MTPRRRAMLIVGLILLLLAVIIFTIILLLRVVPVALTPVAPAVGTPTPINQPSVSEVKFESPLIAQNSVSPGNTAARQMAELFAERYGSYSNQGNYQNLSDLLPVMTSSFRQATEAYLKTADTSPGQQFEGVTSKKVSTQTRSESSTTAVIAVSLQQQKTTGAAAPTIGYRTLRVELVLIGNEWRVDAAAWEN